MSQRIRKPYSSPATGLLLGLTLTTAAVGCSGKGYSIPGFSSKQNKDQVQEVESKPPLENPNPIAQNELGHIAEAEIRLGESSQDMSPVSYEKNQSLPTHSQGVSPDFAALMNSQQIDDAFEQQNLSVGNGSSAGYQGLVQSVDAGTSNLDALRDSLNELNATTSDEPFAESLPEQSIEPAGRAYLPQISVEPEIQEEVAPVEENSQEEFPWAKRSPTGPVVEKVKGMLNRATVATQETGRIGTQKITETTRSLIATTQSVLTPEQKSAEQILQEMEARREARLGQQKPSQSVADASLDLDDPHADLPPAVVIDLSREWINGSTDSLQPHDSITQFAQSTVTANQSAQLPLVTPARPVSVYLEDPQTIKTSVPGVQGRDTSKNRQVLPLGELPVQDQNQHEMISGVQEGQPEMSAPAFNASPSIQLTPQEDAAPFIVESGPSLGSAPLLLLPGTEPAAQEDDKFAADFAGMTVNDSLPVEESPLLIDEAELQQQAKSNPRISNSNLTMLMAGLGVLLLFLVRWRR
ncbi:MAG: hypothetical protein KDA78_14020 [Planctomycetaceae bacterium]|nr:hypothetical protein [Planctomycetaceae bacterium]